MRLLAIDQSMSNCALVVFEDDKVIYKKVVSTGSNASSGKKKKSVIYFDKDIEQMAHICQEVSTLVQQFEIESVVLESLSFSSIGNATRTLAGLFYCINYTLLLDGFPVKDIHTITPTQVKSFARQFLPEDERESKNSKGKSIKMKMTKKEMIKAAESLDNTLLVGYTLSSGKGDLADAYLIGLKWRNDNGKS